MTPPLVKVAKPAFPKAKVTPVQSDPVDNTCEEEPSATKKTRTKRNWTEETMAEALQARDNGLSLEKCSIQFGISKTAISNWEEGRTFKKKKGPQIVFTEGEENALLQWIFAKCDSGHGASVLDVKLKVAEICQTRHTLFSNGIPCKSWWAGFRKRHPNLVFRVGESLDQSRATRFRPEIVKSLHDNLHSSYEKHKYPPSNIWNANEIGFQGSRDKGMKILARKGAKAVYNVTCDSREWMTVLCCVNAAGQAIPSYYIFNGSRIIGNYIQNCEVGAAMAVQKKAWMTGEIFQAWLEHFDKAITKLVGKESRHLLILDGHGSHVSLEVVEKARDWGIDLITLLAHTSHKLQPLDVSVFKSLKTHFCKERDIWHLQTLTRQASKTELATIAAKAIDSALTEANIKSGFKATEIWPFNPNALNFDNMPCNHISIVDVKALRN
ncbi:hypothetical protein L7F22_005784 [Adiantum nelumboides]|nr:hypothetical protein [Adiantum nelumboides]